MEQWRAAWALYEAASDADPAARAEMLHSGTVDPAIVEEVLNMLAKSGTSAAGDHSGEKVGRFNVISLIGRGGMAEVYLARDTELDRSTALKFVPVRNVGGLSIERSIREARAASAVNHPNIVTIYEVIRTGDTLVIAMELVEGMPLRKHCGAAMPLEQGVAWSHQISSALAAAHAEGIMHLDLKPENIMVRKDGLLKVLDFGLARFVEQEGSGSTRPAGTLRYMAPEQYLSEGATPATDVFALGLVMYEMFTGSHPFAAGTMFETAHAIATAEPVRPSARNRMIPAKLDQLLVAMMAKNPRARPTAPQVLQALKKLQEPDANPVREPAPIPGETGVKSSSRRWLWWAAAGVAVAVVAAAIALWRPSPVTPSGGIVRAMGLDDPIAPRHFYAIHAKGSLAAYVDDSSDVSGSHWPVERAMLPAMEGVAWGSFRKVFAAGDGVIYAITADGELKYFRLLDPWRNSGPMRWSSDSNTVIGKGWAGVRDAVAMSRPVWAPLEGPAVTSETSVARNGVLWAFTDSKKTLLFRHGWAADGRPSAGEFEAGTDYTAHYGGPSLPPGHACSGCQVFEGGDGITFVISKEGELWRYRVRSSGDWVQPKGKIIRDRFGVRIGHEWNMWASTMAAPGAYSIEGYVSNSGPTMSLFAGEPIPVRASTFSPSYTIRLLRLERRREDNSGLVDGRLAGNSVTREAPAGGHFKKRLDFDMSAKGAAWPGDGPDPVLPADARSGIYAAELTTPSGGRALAPFVVKPRPDARPNNIAVIANTLTWHGLNSWGARGLPAGEISFERPLLETPVLGGASRSPGLTDRNPRTFNQLVRAEVWVTTWLDGLAARDARYGWDAFTDLDLDAGIPRLQDYKAVVIQTLPQFWTDRMRDHLEQYLKNGGHVVYLAGKGLYQRVAITGEGKMRIPTAVGTRCALPPEGPPPLPANPCTTLELFRWGNAAYPDGRSERSLLGLAYEPWLPHAGEKGNSFVIQSAHPFLMKGTGLQVGSPVGHRAGLAGLMAADWGQAWRLPGAVYKEFQDSMASATHATVTGADLADSGEPRTSIVFREAGARGWVFAIGATSVGGVLAVDPALQRIVTNALDAAISGSKP